MRRVTSRIRMHLLAGVAMSALVVGIPGAPARAQSWFPRTGVWVDVEGGFVWMRGTRQPWAALVSDSSAGAGVTNLLTVRPDEGWNGRVQIGLRSAEWDMAIVYTGLRARSASGSFARPGSTDSGYIAPVLGATRNTIPYATYPSAFAGVKTRRQMDVGDFEVGYNMELGSRATVRLFGGVRVASWRQQTDTFFREQYTDFFIATVDEQHRARFLGAGPRLGVGGTVPVAPLGFGQLDVVGDLAGAILFGNSRARTQTVSFADTGFGSLVGATLTDEYTESRTKAVYNLGASLALQFRFALGGAAAAIRAGYRFEGWWGIVNTSGRPNALSLTTAAVDGRFGTRNGHQYTHGPILGLHIEF